MRPLLTVHFMGYGMTACQMEGVPKEWSQGHRWSADWEDVTCEHCLKGKEPIDTYTLSPDGKTITCKRCGRTSHSPGDVEHRWCEYCKVAHDDLWAPARRWWIDHPEPDMVHVTCDKCQFRLGILKKDLMELKARGFTQCHKCGHPMNIKKQLRSLA